jgi:AcrR family transcriptional regulator
VIILSYKLDRLISRFDIYIMEKKEQILETALNLFIENGFDKTPTSRIALDAGVATGTLFHHFKTKEELINALYFEIKTDISKIISEGLEKAEGIKEKMHLIWHNYLSWAMKHPKRLQFLTQFSESQYITKLTKQRIYDEHLRFVFEIIEDGKKRGIFYNLPNELLTSIFGGVLHQIIRFILEAPVNFDDKEFIDEAFMASWNAIAKSS